jgi:signal transduction histidine kinase
LRGTGIEISAEAIPQIFAEFYQLNSAMTRRYEGAGLGLAIAKRLVEQIGDTLTVESRPGASFTIHLRTRSPTAERASDE